LIKVLPESVGKTLKMFWGYWESKNLKMPNVNAKKIYLFFYLKLLGKLLKS
jgi:hypothetical protein